MFPKIEFKDTFKDKEKSISSWKENMWKDLYSNFIYDKALETQYKVKTLPSNNVKVEFPSITFTSNPSISSSDHTINSFPPKELPKYYYVPNVELTDITYTPSITTIPDFIIEKKEYQIDGKIRLYGYIEISEGSLLPESINLKDNVISTKKQLDKQSTRFNNIEIDD